MLTVTAGGQVRKSLVARDTKFAYSLPLNKGAPINNSARMHPIDHTSTVEYERHALVKRRRTDLLYCIFCDRSIGQRTTTELKLGCVYRYASMISGALYHRVATYSVKWVTFSSGSASKPLAKPKSHILSSQSAFTRRFPGLRSRCITPAECMYFIPVASQRALRSK